MGYLDKNGLARVWQKINAKLEGLADAENLAFEGGKIVLANKSYRPESHSGLGRVYLKRNIVSGKNVLTQTLMSAPNTRYIIQYDYDLNAQTIVVPHNSVLVFAGGSFANGAIKGEDVVIESGAPCFDKTLTILPGT